MRLCTAFAAACLLFAAGAASAAHERPKGVLAPARLLPLPASAVATCRTLQAQVHFTVLCPSRLPRATRHWRHDSRPPRLESEYAGDRFHPRRPGLLGLTFGYGAPIEPQSGRWFWSRRGWLHAPAYFLHFTLWRLGPQRFPPRLSRRCFGDRCGRVAYAAGYGLRPGRGYYWTNHTWFFWTEHGARWAASLHYFGRPHTTALLARILATLVPAREL